MAAQYPWSLTLIIPALNEEAVVRGVVEQVLAEVEGKVREYEVILIDDGSTDLTGEVMEQIARDRKGVRVLHNPGNIGLGASYRRGVKEARCQYVMLLCGDGGFPASSLPAVFEKIGQADIVVPYMSNLRELKTPARYLLSRAYTSLLNFLFGFKLHYYNGLPVHRVDLLRRISITSTGFGFQGEVLVKLLKSGCSHVQVAVLGAEHTRRSVALRPTNLISVARTLIHLLKEIVRFKPIPIQEIKNGRPDFLSDDEAASTQGRWQ
jgi:dolichol-phosphate mannosyltransferase